jgi:flagellar biosynthetic protein FliR
MFISSLMMAGQIMDMQMGFSMANVYDPATNGEYCRYQANLYNYMFLLVFFYIHGHRTLFSDNGAYSFMRFPSPVPDAFRNGFRGIPCPYVFGKFLLWR